MRMGRKMGTGRATFGARRRRRQLLAVGVAVSLGLSCTAPAQSMDDGPTYDTSGLDIFWEMVDILAADRAPTEAEWNRLLEHPGYRVIERSGSRAAPLRTCMSVVFRPSRHDELEATMEDGDSRVRRICGHLEGARDRREELLRFARAALDGEELLEAIEQASRYLPDDGTTGEPPATYVILFEPNGFGGASLALDVVMLNDVSRRMRVEYLAHEFHHVYKNRLSTVSVPEDDPDARLVGALSRLAEEGIASLLDKRSWLEPAYTDTLPEPWLGVGAEFRELYAGAPDALAAIDAALRGVGADSVAAGDAGRTISSALPWGGHPTGMYMALAIERDGGPERIAPLATDHLEFLLAYQDVASQNDALYRFSDEALVVLRRLAREY